MKFSREQLRKAVFWFVPLFVIFMGIWLFIEVADEVVEQEIESFDRAVIDYIQGLVSEPMTAFFTGVTTIGNASVIGGLTALIAVVLFIKRRFGLGIFVLVVNAGGGLLNYGLKALFSRERPDFLVLIDQGGFSFPSGHAMGSFIFFGTVSALVFLLVKSNAVGAVVAVLAAVMSFLIGTSRVYLGVHFPSDIIAGFSVGASWLTLCLMIYLFFHTRKKRRLARAAA